MQASMWTRALLQQKFGLTRAQLDRMKTHDLLTPSVVETGGNKQKFYNEEKLERLFYICLLKRMEFSTPEIKKIIGSESGIENKTFKEPDGKEVNEIFDRRIAGMEEKIKMLTELVLLAKYVQLNGFDSCFDMVDITDMTFDEYLDYINIAFGDGYNEAEFSNEEKVLIEREQKIVNLQDIIFSEDYSDEEKAKATEELSSLIEVDDLVKYSEKLSEIFKLKDEDASSDIVQVNIEALYKITLHLNKLDEEMYERTDFAHELFDRILGEGQIAQSFREQYDIKECIFLAKALLTYIDNNLES